MNDLFLPDNPMPFAGSRVDFAEMDRSEARLAELQDLDRASTLLLHKGRVAAQEGRLLRAHPHSAVLQSSFDPGLIFLGLENDGDPVFALSVKDETIIPEEDWIDLRMDGRRLLPDELAVAGRARSIFDWHRTHLFCARCGEKSEPTDGGAKRVCQACETEHFPRVNPVVIFLVEHENLILLGRGIGWPPGFFSALAGFVSPGETIEEATKRECLEEVGITLTDHRYLFCQPWPFPSQLMIGLISQAEGTDIRIDPKELEEARWFTRDEVLAVFEKRSEAFRRPPRTTIAHQLLRAWLSEEPEG